MNIDYKVENKTKAYTNISLTIPQTVFKKEYDILLKQQAQKTDIKGFRKGKVPSQIIEPQLKHAISVEALDKIVPTYLTEIIQTENLELLAPPEYTELADLNSEKDITLKIKFTTMPEFKLGDLKKVKVKKESTAVKKEEIENTLKEMFERSLIEDKGAKPNDKWAKKTGELYKLTTVKNMDDLEKEITKLLKTEKERIVTQNAENEIIKKTIEVSKIEIPKEAVEFEARERERAFLNDLRNAKMSLEDFCKNNNTDIKTLRELWEKDSTEALQADALLKLYGKTKEIDVTEKEIEERIATLKQTRGEEIPEEIEKDPVWRNNIKNVMIKQKAYRKLIDEVLKK